MSSRHRTLEFKGTKIVEVRVADKMAVTHSYTIQVHISKAGILGKHIFICFREPTGTVFGPKVQEAIEELLSTCRNVRVACSKSGKFSKSIMQEWFNQVFLLDKGDDPSLLILDSWSGQGPSAELEASNLMIDYIPKGATKYVQPLDVYFFRQYKLLVKNIVEHCRDAYFRNETTVKPSNRFFVIKLHSFCFNQLHHPRFSRMWMYAWQEAGYHFGEPILTFENVIEILLVHRRSREAKCNAHAEFPIVKCVYCGVFLCLRCLIEPIHL